MNADAIIHSPAIPLTQPFAGKVRANEKPSIAVTIPVIKSLQISSTGTNRQIAATINQMPSSPIIVPLVFIESLRPLKCPLTLCKFDSGNRLASERWLTNCTWICRNRRRDAGAKPKEHAAGKCTRTQQRYRSASRCTLGDKKLTERDGGHPRPSGRSVRTLSKDPLCS